MFLAYYIILTTAENMCENGVLPLVLGMLLPNILFAMLAIFLFHRVHREKPLIPEPIQYLLHILRNLRLHHLGQ